MSVIAEGFAFLEGPRWRDNSLYFSDMHNEAVFRWSEADGVVKIVDVPARPSGLGWDPQGKLLIVSMKDRCLVRWDGRALETVADLSSIATFDTNDMVVDARGGAYIGNFGSSIESEEVTFPDPAKLVYVSPSGEPRAVADDLLFPNGSANKYGQQLYAYLDKAKALGARGIYQGAVTGELDRTTREAIRSFQLKRGLNSTILSTESARLLGLVEIDLS